MDAFFGVLRIILIACVSALLLIVAIFSLSKTIISWVSVDLEPEKFTYFAVVALGGTAALGLQFYGKWFNERSHLYEQWAKGIELISSEEESKILGGIEILAELGSQAKRSYKYRVITALIEHLRRKSDCGLLVQTSILNAISRILVVRRKMLLEPFEAFSLKRSEKAIDFTGLHFKVPVRMSGLRFPRRVCFDGSIFEKDVDLSGSIFHGEVSIKDCRFCADAAFSETQFSGIFRLDGGCFEGGAIFSGALFKEEFLSEGQEFRGVVDFSGAHFYKDARFLPSAEVGRRDFHNIVRFQNVNFYRDVHFGEVELVGSGQSGALSFWSEAHFDASYFYGDAIFRGIFFREGANFGIQRRRAGAEGASRAAQFFGLADFSGADFNLLSSQGGRLRNVTNFNGVRFHKKFIFWR